MYTAIWVVLLGIAALLFVTGINKRSRGRVFTGIVIGILTVLFFYLLEFLGEMWWFQALGFGDRFWTQVLAQFGAVIGGAVIGAGVAWVLTLGVSRGTSFGKNWLLLIAAVIGGFNGYGSWELPLLYAFGVSGDLADPILGVETGFYLFALPFFMALLALLFQVTVLALVWVAFAPFVRIGDRIVLASPELAATEHKRIFRPLILPSVVLLILIAIQLFFGRYSLLYSEYGVVHGPGWTDVNVRLPMLWTLAIISLVFAVILALSGPREAIQRFIDKQRGMQFSPYPRANLLGAFGGALVVLYLILLVLIPYLFQWLAVDPNEITYEEPYISNNIEFTRHAFGLDRVEEYEYPFEGDLTRSTVEQKGEIFDNIRLWDYRALDAVYKQFQEIRLYYEFNDVDVDRYTINDEYRQVMVSAREMEVDNLPAQSKTFVNRRFKYTHGYGITLAPVSVFTEQGLPDMLIKDIPPKVFAEGLEIDRPEIYYGELTNTYVVANSEEPEFDYPQADSNKYVHYEGDGGVQLSSVWRKFAYGYILDGTRFFVSSYPRESSRLMFDRQIETRVKKIAPFLKFDEDPYIVLADGQLYWIIDGYTVSNDYPYSEPFSGREIIEYQQGEQRMALFGEIAPGLRNINYIRNSVKTVVNAYNGEVTMYVYEPDDPLIQAWQAIFPDLFEPRDDMPEGLQKHVRYPEDMLLVQGLVYAKYHMTNPTVFYNQEDLWIRATEKYYGDVQPVQPYYVMWSPPQSDDVQFSLILPFTPKNRQVLIGWIAGLSDGENYGRFLAYQFPKDKRVLGPQQVETKIDQDRFLSGQLTLWDQRGSNVIRGNVLAIPVERTLFYVEPIYLQAETAAYPELRLVAIMHGDDLSYGPSFADALAGLFEENIPGFEAEEAGAPAIGREELIRRANDAFQRYLEAQGKGDFQSGASALETLQESLKRLSESTPETPEE